MTRDAVVNECCGERVSVGVVDYRGPLKCASLPFLASRVRYRSLTNQLQQFRFDLRILHSTIHNPRTQYLSSLTNIQKQKSLLSLHVLRVVSFSSVGILSSFVSSILDPFIRLLSWSHVVFFSIYLPSPLSSSADFTRPAPLSRMTFCSVSRVDFACTFLCVSLSR